MELNNLMVEDRTQSGQPKYYQKHPHNKKDNQLMPTPPTTFSLTNWALTALLSVALAGGGWYAKWINDGMVANRNDIQVLMVKHIDDMHNLDIIDAKVNLLLEFNQLKYNGPIYKSSPPTETKP